MTKKYITLVYWFPNKEENALRLAGYSFFWTMFWGLIFIILKNDVARYFIFIGVTIGVISVIANLIINRENIFEKNKI